MLVKFMTKGKPTLVNVNSIVGVRKDTDQKSGEYMTKIFLSTGLLVFVDEEMNVVHQMVNGVLNKTTDIDYSYDVPSVDEKFQSQYNRDMDSYDDRQPRTTYQPRSWKPRTNYNERY
jgi:hypothetical protein